MEQLWEHDLFAKPAPCILLCKASHSQVDFGARSLWLSARSAWGSRGPPGTMDVWEMLMCEKHLLRHTLAVKKEIKRISPIQLPSASPS